MDKYSIIGIRQCGPGPDSPNSLLLPSDSGLLSSAMMAKNFSPTVILGWSIPSTGITLLTAGSDVDANVANATAEVFSPRGTQVRVKHSNY